eukprot:RCo044487
MGASLATSEDSLYGPPGCSTDPPLPPLPQPPASTTPDSYKATSRTPGTQRKPPHPLRPLTPSIASQRPAADEGPRGGSRTAYPSPTSGTSLPSPARPSTSTSSCRPPPTFQPSVNPSNVPPRYLRKSLRYLAPVIYDTPGNSAPVTLPSSGPPTADYVTALKLKIAQGQGQVGGKFFGSAQLPNVRLTAASLSGSVPPLSLRSHRKSSSAAAKGAPHKPFQQQGLSSGAEDPMADAHEDERQEKGNPHNRGNFDPCKFRSAVVSPAGMTFPTPCAREVLASEIEAGMLPSLRGSSSAPSRTTTPAKSRESPSTAGTTSLPCTPNTAYRPFTPASQGSTSYGFCPDDLHAGEDGAYPVVSVGPGELSFYSPEMQLDSEQVDDGSGSEDGVSPSRGPVYSLVDGNDAEVSGSPPHSPGSGNG